MDWYLHQNVKFVIPIRELGRKRIFDVDEIKYFETYYNDLEIVTVDDQHFMTCLLYTSRSTCYQWNICR